MNVRLSIALLLSALIAACAGPGGGNTSGDAFVAPTATCDDGVLNQDESAVDCGGATCDGCDVGAACGDGSDCSSGFCDNGQCAVGQCGNGVQDPSEEGVDCGGTCPACLGATCGANGDCASGYCDNGACATPSCVDGITNGTETATDCGGDCPACGDGSACSADNDCTSGFCDAGTCGPPPATCQDGETNGNETGEDCGGPDCPTCPPGSPCSAPTDCASGQCVSGQCEALATCGDGVKNGTESDVDCGGGGCEPCASGKDCGDDSDCLSNECVFGQCITPLCNDGMANGDETDVDCGGNCPGCDVGDLCDVGGDCASGVCEAGSCVPAPTCDDSTLNGQETDTDCGGPDCDPCGLDAACVVDADCLDADCIASTCKVPTCSDGVLNQDELAIDCGGDVCDPCGTDAPCNGPSDCESGVCTDDACVAATCSDGVLNQGEIDADCGGPNCALCDIGATCATSPACSSGVCDQGVCILDFVQVTSADARFCGITTHDGSIRCWGESDPSWAAPPAGTGYIHVAMGVTAEFTQTSDANKICALDAGGLATCNFQTTLPTDVPFSQLVIGTVEGGFVCGMFAEADTTHVAGGIQCYGTTGPINSYPFDPFEAFESMSSPTHRWQVFAQKANGEIAGEGYDTIYFAILDAAAGPFVAGSLNTSRFRVGAVLDPEDGGYQPAYESSGASPPLTPPTDDGAVVFGASQDIDPTSFRVGHYDVALSGSTSELVISGPLEVPDPADVPTAPVSHLWHGEWHTCTKHGEGAPLTCWGLPAFGDPTPPTL